MGIKTFSSKLAISAVLLASSFGATAATATADYLGFTVIATTGTAGISFTSETPYSADSYVDGGIPDFANDGVTFSSEVNVFGDEATATNAGFSSSTFVIALDGASADASTETDITFDIVGEGDIYIAFDFDLFTEAFEPGSFAEAAIWFYSDDTYGESYIYSDALFGEYTDSKDDGSLVLKLVADGPSTEYVTVGTYVSVSSVPVPAAIWLFGSALVGLVSINSRK